MDELAHQLEEELSQIITKGLKVSERSAYALLLMALDFFKSTDAEISDTDFYEKIPLCAKNCVNAVSALRALLSTTPSQNYDFTGLNEAIAKAQSDTRDAICKFDLPNDLDAYCRAAHRLAMLQHLCFKYKEGKAIYSEHLSSERGDLLGIARELCKLSGTLAAAQCLKNPQRTYQTAFTRQYRWYAQIVTEDYCHEKYCLPLSELNGFPPHKKRISPLAQAFPLEVGLDIE